MVDPVWRLEQAPTANSLSANCAAPLAGVNIIYLGFYGIIQYQAPKLGILTMIHVKEVVVTAPVGNGFRRAMRLLFLELGCLQP